MLKKIAFLLISTLFTNLILAGTLKGTIKNEAGEPLSFATIFIPETGSGAVTNEDGFYEIRLKSGTYKIIFQYLGYEAVQETVTIAGNEVRTLDIVLPPETLDLGTVEITDGRENPAYTIMRKAIAKAEFHQNQFDSYTGRVYIKGSGRLLDSPKLLEKMMEKEGVDSTTAFLVESVSEIEFKRPNNFTEKVLSIRQQGDNNETSPNPYINSSFYSPQVVESVSPLSNKAFGYYKFEFLGSYHERDYEVNKIKVTPRSRGEGVFEGTISIVEDLWNIHSLDLATHKLGAKINLKQVYAPIEESAWLPVTYNLTINMKIFGFRFVYDYLATVSDYDIELNPDLNYDIKLIDEKIDTELAAELKNKHTGNSFEMKIASGEELTRKDLRKMMKEYKKEEQKEIEEPKMLENYSHSIDSMAQNRDTAFWESVRPIPLTEYELKAYKRVDSLAVVTKEREENGTTDEEIKQEEKNNKFGSGLGSILYGETWKTGKHSAFMYGGLMDGGLNTVQGYYLGTKFQFRQRLGNKQNLKIGVLPIYEFGRDQLIGKGYVDLGLGGQYRKGTLRMEGGRSVVQLNEENPIHPIINAVYTVFFEDNFMKVYEKDFLNLKYDQRISDNFTLKLGGEYGQRKSLQNSRTKPYIDDKDDAFTSNHPFNSAIDTTFFETNTAFTFDAGFEWKPWMRYKVSNGNKNFTNLGPTILANYKKGLKDVDYDLVELGVKYNWVRYDGSRLDVKLIAGKLLNDNELAFPDFKHFPGSRTIFVTSDPLESYRLLDYYRHSTNDEYLQLHLHYQFRKLLITQIPAVWQRGFKENVFANYLATPTSNNYMEIGYGLDNIFRFLRIEFTASFEDFKYKDFGIRIGISTGIGVNVDSGEDGVNLSFGI